MRTPRATDASSRQRGFILALLLGLMMVMGILLMKAVPSVIVEVQRGNEEELIFRGEAMARGIRLFQQRTGAYPTRLEDMMKMRPPVIRKLYKDPMTQDGEWDVVTAVPVGASGDKTGLPIAGVRSRSQKDSIKMYRGKTLYSDWVFSAADDILGIPGSGLPAASGVLQSGYSTTTKGGGTSTPDPDKK
jgi:type II secretory pathway pseudopilin PulG